MTEDPRNTAGCWSCRAPATARRIAAETVIRGRAPWAGGPYRVFRCTSCGIENGVLQDARGRRLLYPLSGLEAPSLLDHLLSRAERVRLERSRAWWRHHRDHVERFRRGTPEALVDAVPPPPPRRSAARATQRPAPPGAPRPPRPTTPRRVAATSGPRAVLGVPDDATDEEIRRAFRHLAKRLHPDRAARSGLSTDEAAARFRAVRAAYDALLRRDK